MSGIRFGVWAAMAVILVPLAGAQSYTVTDLGVLAGGTFSSPSAINDLGEVVGSAGVSNTNNAFLWTAAEGMQNLGTLDGDSTSVATGINNLGEVVGWSYPGSSLGVPGQAFIWTASGGMRPLGPVNGTTLIPATITDSDEIVGTYYLPNNNTDGRAFLMTKTGALQGLGTLGGPDSGASAINKSGEIVGFSDLMRNGQPHAFLWTASGGMEDLGLLNGGTFSLANAINASGEVFGSASSSKIEPGEAIFWTQSLGLEPLGTGPGSAVYAVGFSGQLVGSFGGDLNRALLWTEANKAQDLNDLIPPNSGWVLISASGINRAGQIIVRGTINGQTHAALLTPMN